MPIDIPIKTEVIATYPAEDPGKVKYSDDIIRYIRHEAERLTSNKIPTSKNAKPLNQGVLCK